MDAHGSGVHVGARGKPRMSYLRSHSSCFVCEFAWSSTTRLHRLEIPCHLPLPSQSWDRKHIRLTFFFLTWASGVVHRSSCFQDKHVVNGALLSPFLIGGSFDLAMFIEVEGMTVSHDI